MGLTKREYRRLKIAEVSEAAAALDDALRGAAWTPDGPDGSGVLGFCQEVRAYRDFLKATSPENWPALPPHIRTSDALRRAYQRRFSR